MTGNSLIFVVVAIAGAVTAALNLITSWLARRGEAAYPPVGEFVEVDGVRLHYIRQGSGRPIVFLHGSDGFLQDFADSVVDSLVSDGCCIAFDRPGHGYSDVPRSEPPTLEVQAGLIHDALKALGVERPILVGHSWGAALAVCYASSYPEEVAGLALVAGYLYPAAKVTSRLLRLPLRLLVALPRIPLLGTFIVSTFTPIVKTALMRIGLSLAFSPDPVPTGYARKARALWVRTPARVRALAQESATDEPILARLAARYAEIRLPIHLCAGDSDQILPPGRHSRQFHRDAPRSRLTVIKGAGHQLMQTHPEAVIALVRQCLADAPLAAPTVEREPAPCIISDHARARELVFRFGWNATSYQILNPAMHHWFAPDREAAVGYVTKHNVRVAAGAPVCEEGRLGEAALRFEADAKAAGQSVCWFAVADRLREALEREPRHALIVIGAQPTWRPGRWPEIVNRNSSLRAQLNRARNKGVAVEEWERETAASHPDLEAILEEWMETRVMPRLGFLTEPVSLARLADRRIFVALLNGRETAFLVCVPVPKRGGWLIEQIARARQTPNGCAELLVDHAMRALASEGAEFVTLGLAPLSRRAAAGTAGHAVPVVRLLLRWVRAHGKRFYNFEGLDAFKAKLRPDHWEPLYAISNERIVSFRTLYAIAAAFSDGPPAAFVVRAIVSAAKQEWEWLCGRVWRRNEA